MVDAAIKTAIATGAFKMVWLVEIGFDTPLRLTDAEHVIHYGGNHYTPWPGINVTAPKQETGGGVTVSMDDDGTIDAIESADDAAGRDLTVIRLYSTGSGDKAVTEWSGIIENYDCENYTRCIFRADAPHLLRVGPAMPIWASECINDFKSAQCGYSGATTVCKGSWAECDAMNNTTNFISALKAPTPGEIVVIGGQRYTVGGYQPPPPNEPPGTPPPWRPTAHVDPRAVPAEPEES